MEKWKISAAILILYVCSGVSLDLGSRYMNMEEKIAAVFNKVAHKDTDKTKKEETPFVVVPPRRTTSTTTTTTTTTSTTKPTTTTSTTTTRPPTTTREEHVFVDGYPAFDAEERHILGVNGDPRLQHPPEAYTVSPSATSVYLNFAGEEKPSVQNRSHSTEKPPSDSPKAEPPRQAYMSTVMLKLGLYWDVHIYVFGIVYVCLGVYAALSILRALKLPTKGYLMAVIVFMLIWSLIRSVEILYDAYNAQGKVSRILGNVLSNLCPPIASAAFAFLFLGILQSSNVRLCTAYFQNPITLCGIVTLHSLVAIVTAILVGWHPEGHFMFLVFNVANLVWLILLAAMFMWNFKKLMSTSRRTENDFAHELFSHYHLEGHLVTRPTARPTLSRATNITIFISLVGVGLSTIMLFGLIFLFGAWNERSPLPWPWWGYQITTRFLEALFSALLIYVASNPLRYFYLTRAKVIMEAPSKCSVFCMSPCESETWQSAGEPKNVEYSSHTTAIPIVNGEHVYASSGYNSGKNLTLVSVGGRIYNDHQAMYPGYCYSISRDQRRCGGCRPPVPNSVASEMQRQHSPRPSASTLGPCGCGSRMPLPTQGTLPASHMGRCGTRAHPPAQPPHHLQTPPASPHYWEPRLVTGNRMPDSSAIYQEPIDLNAQQKQQQGLMQYHSPKDGPHGLSTTEDKPGSLRDGGGYRSSKGPKGSQVRSKRHGGGERSESHKRKRSSNARSSSYRHQFPKTNFGSSEDETEGHLRAPVSSEPMFNGRLRDCDDQSSTSSQGSSVQGHEGGEGEESPSQVNSLTQFLQNSKPPTQAEGQDAGIGSHPPNPPQSFGRHRPSSGSNNSIDVSEGVHQHSYLYSPLDCEGASRGSSLRRSWSDGRVDAGSPDSDTASKPLLSMIIPAPPPPALIPSKKEPPDTSKSKSRHSRNGRGIN
ncbi:unnamed protein product [Cyprideis torosa]|uniref:Proline-rich transmembrane protein 3/4 domain-containing protein n=1 Tax=Cyprideis torosa TaxID=163714 RepID=A0A7R8W8G4_9CRUS|nr:unnamed protein product [Cyprideis torosa]CAG0888539.1 unnamed protein product [Cyprideis torosa]